MNSPTQDNYDLEPSDAAPQSPSGASSAPKPHSIGIPKSSSAEPLPLESVEESIPKHSVKDLDVCPSCGATMRSSDQLVCIRCGFDLKNMQPVQTKLGEVVAGDDDDDFLEGSSQAALIQPGNGGFWLPAILAAVAGLVVLVGYLAGLPGLFPHIELAIVDGQAVSIAFLDRMSGLARALVLTAMQVACGMAALTLLAAVLGRKTAATIDDLKLGLMRMLAIIVTMRLATLLAIPSSTMEWMVETALQLAVFAGLSIALFRLKPRDAGTLTGAALITFLLLWMSAYAVIWAARV